MTIDDEKRRLRREIAARSRGAAPPGPERLRASDLAQRRLLDAGLLAGARAVALYRPLPNEVGTGLLAAALAESGCVVVFPRVEEGARVLAFHPAGGRLVRSSLGIEEPAPGAGAPLPLQALEVIVLPGLAADWTGARLGRGRGHYDATLAAAPGALRVMLAFEDSLVERLPVGEHDARLDLLCTESRLVRFPPRPEQRAPRRSVDPGR